jgi:hypothetical protein
MQMETIELLKGTEKVLVEPGSKAEAKWRKAGYRAESEAQAKPKTKPGAAKGR